jgi:hypothetical protein
MEQLDLRTPQFVPFEKPVQQAVSVPQAILEARQAFLVEVELTKLLNRPISVAPPQPPGKKFEPVKRDVYPEMHFRRLADGGYVVGIELPDDRYRSATGPTVVEALQTLLERLKETT